MSGTNHEMSELADRLALRALAERYAFACDERDADALGSCFVDGATLVVHYHDRDAITIPFPEGAPRIATTLGQWERTLHFVGNHRATIDGDVATTVTYCFAHHISGSDDHVMAIRYHDTCRRTPDGWRITERHLYEDWTEDTTVSA